MSQTILIVEDEKRIAHWVKRYFERAGFSTEIAYDGAKSPCPQPRPRFDCAGFDAAEPRWDGDLPHFAPRIGCAHHHPYCQGVTARPHQWARERGR